MSEDTTDDGTVYFVGVCPKCEVDMQMSARPHDEKTISEATIARFSKVPCPLCDDGTLVPMKVVSQEEYEKACKIQEDEHLVDQFVFTTGGQQ